MAGNNFPRPRGQTNHPAPDATTRSNSYDGLAKQSSAYDYQDQADLVGAMFPYSSIPRTVPSQRDFSHDGTSSFYNNSNAEESGQQDDLALTAPPGQDFLFYLDNPVQHSDPGISSTFQLAQHPRGEPQHGPWNPVDAAGGQSSAKIRAQANHAQTHLSSQNQNRAILRTPSQQSRPDSGYYTLSSGGRQDAHAHETETTGTTETIEQMMDSTYPFTSPYEPSVSESHNTGFPEQVGQEQEQMVPNSSHGRQLSSQSHPDQPIRCPQGGCKEVFATQSQLTKHVARHELQYKCEVQGCKRAKGFSTVNDLDRHKKTVHKQYRLGRVYKCFGETCLKTNKIWPRLDNFKIHISKLHADEDEEVLVKRAEKWADANVQRAIETQANITEPRPRSRSTTDSFLAAGSPSGGHFSIGTPLQAYGPSATTISPQELDQRSSSSQYLSPNWHLQRSSGSGRSRSSVDAQLTGSPMLRTLSSSSRAYRSSSTRDSNHAGQAPRPTHQGNHFLQQQYRAQVPLIVTPQPVSHNQEHQAIRSLPSAHSRHPSVFLARIPADNPTTVLYAFGKGRSGLSKAKTAPVAEMAPLNERLIEADSTMPQVTHSTPAGDKHNLAAGLGSHLESDTISESPSDIDLKSVDQFSPGLFKSDEASLWQSILSELPDGTDPSLVEDVVKKTLRSVGSASRGKSSSTALTPKDVDPSHAQKIRRPDGKEAYVCPSCKKETRRLSEMNKHQRRHTKPYGCTFDKCYKTFGSKNDLKRHEHSQHEQLESWRCEELIENSDPCCQLFMRRELFVTHLMTKHGMCELETKEPLRKQRISRMHQPNYWCGFCRSIQTMDKKGIPGDNERFDHIVKHFIIERRQIEDWLPAEGHQTKGKLRMEKDNERSKNPSASEETEEVAEGDVDEPDEDDDEEDDDCDGESEETSPPSSDGQSNQAEQPSPTPLQYLQKGFGQSEPLQVQLSAPQPTTKKRKASSPAGSRDGPPSEPAAEAQTSGARHVRQRPAETAICCQCQKDKCMLEPPQVLAINKSCSTCSHRFCDNCGYR